ncbi:molybdopterin molybdotransferase MoeA [Flammeovirga kamogawensis]|uniref:Molybdopterin molybdenumtransferase n=1 Tax=Flammeovirga kamogawensis TaxID=373891 RepID=A0ABX8GUY3_9BACT|nr:molybdopterin molybdotransferase MoeA [Flammeovirga kamogawensis]MBB6461670.1 molybdopterin molybdotransferase [Flammeovirga kamogawensis]QWG07404.1 molybdopterin molybdotransferase MoeA [Flammeovirga kamogawensis]TRX69216.1 molybdopterin molybdotransferase MoeA [Flammeovirga kamogawensis]
MQNHLIEPSKVDEIISKVHLDLPSEKVNFIESLGRTLAEDIYADRDFPPFDRVAMDGIGIHHSAIENNNNLFAIEGVQPAGSSQLTLKDNGNCIEVMTGAILPKGADVVIPYEWTERKGEKMCVLDFKHAQTFTNVHRKGVDVKKGEVLIKKGTVITSAEIGIITTVGKEEVIVKTLPKVAVIATGDELVGVDQIPADYQIRMSNCYSIQSRLKEEGISSKIYHIVDDKDALKEKIKGLFTSYDIFVFSGGVSKGKFDYLPQVFEELGVVKQFHGVKQRPGKPFWFGITKNNQPIFALPGNPVSTYLCANRYLLPWLRQELNKEINQGKAILDSNYSFSKPLTYFLQVKSYYNKLGELCVSPTTGGGSGDLANLSNADAFVELPSDKNSFKKGDKLPIWFYKK